MNAQPHVVGNGPGAFVRSRIRPNTIGATAPAPKPRKERSASAAPRCAEPTASVRAVESTGESPRAVKPYTAPTTKRSEEHTSELQSHSDLVCRLLLEKKKISEIIVPYP